MAIGAYEALMRLLFWASRGDRDAADLIDQFREAASRHLDANTPPRQVEP